MENIEILRCLVKGQKILVLSPTELKHFDKFKSFIDFMYKLEIYNFKIKDNRIEMPNKGMAEFTFKGRK